MKKNYNKKRLVLIKSLMKKIIKNYSYLFMSKLFACNVFGGSGMSKEFPFTITNWKQSRDSFML